ncbi:MAG: acetolactate synthase [Candidatus Magasanikbacteria bacterium RIFOXYC2_FULL_42_28]|uniref:Acetolactate synthase n=1 Tax=Candidatus Magasanikbacteria bacterium RIFOXYC2_FULL_42_28 TaxID=1798704 RepID=A0A1F6NWV6_9BACT|nr:MAG: acetolactate synthase [Candidatus Magasanikbacteria bacterium RIFOXYC2_FULL_42_28]
MKAAQLLVKGLEQEGVEYVFGVPGEENLDFLEALRQSTTIKFIVTRHEQAAGFMAATYGRLTGKAGVALSTLGPGATNLLTAAAYAQLGGMPLLMITGQKPLRRSKQGHFQIIKTVEMFRPVTKFSRQIASADSIPSLLREAFRSAQEERPGAVHLELPEDIAAENTEAVLYPPTHHLRPSPYHEALDLAIKLINNSKRPLLLIGAAGNRKRVSLALTEFINKTGIPFFTTQLGKGVVDERHPKYLGTAALSQNDYLHCAVERADLIINVGHDVVEKPPFIMHQNGAQVIHINFTPASMDEVYFPQHEVVGDIGNGLKYLTEHLNQQPQWDFSYYEKVAKGLRAHIVEHATDAGWPILPQRLVADVRRAVPEDGIVSLDNGMYKIWFARNYETYLPNTLLLDNALATMGAGLPTAMMAKLKYPDKMVVAVLGDGGFMMNSQELETAMRLKLNLVILILNDGGFGMISWKQKIMNLPDFGLKFNNPDFVKYAESYGAGGYLLKAGDDLAEIIKTAHAKGGVQIIEVPIDYSENDRVLNQELKNKTCLI